MLRKPLWIVARHGRLCLVLGLAAGLLLPETAAALAQWLPFLVAGLLAITAFRIGHNAAFGAITDLPAGIAAVIVLQFILPLGFYLLCVALGVSHTAAGLALVLVTAAPALSGSPNLALMLGLDAGRMMQIMVLGTALFPFTVFPLLWLMPQLGDPHDVLAASFRVMTVIVLSTVAGFGTRAICLPRPTADQLKTTDGVAILAFVAIVVALMAALGPALRADPWTLLAWMIFAFAISYGLQVVGVLICGRRLAPIAGPVALGAGNRNIALFLVALPPEVVAPIMIFVGCWQMPMYLTPILLKTLYSQKAAHV